MAVQYTETTGSLARAAGTTVRTIAKYAELGLISCVRASDGTRLFRPREAKRVRQIYARRMARRTRGVPNGA
jgi:DNA-binding transcriptional MerR regulator